MNALLYVEGNFGGKIPLVKMDKTLIIWHKKVSIEQMKQIYQSVKHINEIIDLKQVQLWCKHFESDVIIFGSRTRGHQREKSDLDIMIFPNQNIPLDEIPSFLEEHHKIIKSFLKEPIELDLKLNTSDLDVYGGFTYTGEELPTEELDFIFEWSDIPSYIMVDQDKIRFEIADTELAFDGDTFAKIK